MTAWSRKKLKKNQIFEVLSKDDLLRGNFQNSSESIHCDTDRRVVFKFREIWPTGNGKNRALLTCQKNFVCLSSSRYCTDRAKNLSGQPPTMYSECSRFYPNRFTFGGVRSISERTNTIKTGQLKSVSNILLKPSFEPHKNSFRWVK